MRKSAIVAGTGFEGRDLTIKRHCREGMEVVLRREPHNKFDNNAVAVYLKIPRFGGLLGNSLVQIGHIKANTAKSLAKAMDSGAMVTGIVKSYWAPEDREFPRVTVEITDEI
ncbi:HIRAN domain-containing protein [Porticoccus sp.]